MSEPKFQVGDVVNFTPVNRKDGLTVTAAITQVRTYDHKAEEYFIEGWVGAIRADQLTMQ